MNVFREYLRKHLNLQYFTVLENIDNSRQSRKLAVIVPDRIQVEEHERTSEQLVIRTPKNSNSENEIQALIQLFNHLNSNIVKFTNDTDAYYITFSYNGIPFNSFDENNNNIYNVQYYLNIKKER